MSVETHSSEHCCCLTNKTSQKLVTELLNVLEAMNVLAFTKLAMHILYSKWQAQDCSKYLNYMHTFEWNLLILQIINSSYINEGQKL